MFHLDRVNSMNISSVVFLLIVIIVYLLGIRALKKIPYEDTKGRLLCAVNFAGYAVPLLFMSSLAFRTPDFLFPSHEWTKTDIVLQRFSENLDSITLAYRVLFNAALVWVMLFLFLLKKALK